MVASEGCNRLEVVLMCAQTPWLIVNSRSPYPEKVQMLLHAGATVWLVEGWTILPFFPDSWRTETQRGTRRCC